MAKSRLEKRKEYVKQVVNSSPEPPTQAVSKLADQLFISERTVWRDLE
jgi:hypothetical protein